MSRTLYPYYCSDISALARSLKQQWAEENSAPSHLHILNMLARAAGFQNFQHWRAECDKPVPAEPSAVSAPTLRLLRHFDSQGRLLRWPKKFSEQQACLWALWSALPRGEWPEKAVNELLREAQAFGDHVLIRRELVELGLIARTPDCRQYWHVAQELPPQMAELASEVRQRRLAA